MTRFARTVRSLSVAPLLIATVLVGCAEQRKTQHDQWVQEANDRWTDIKMAQVLIMARQKFDAGDLDLAESDVKNALAHAPENAHLHMLLGQIDLERGKLERSFQEFTYAIQFKEDLAQAYYLRAIVLQRISKLDLALADYRKAFELQGDNVGYLLAIAETLVSMDRTDDALAVIEPQLDNFDANSGLRMMMGHIYALRHDYNKAAEYFKIAALLAPDSTRPREELAAAQLAAGNTLEATRTYSDVLRDPSMEHRSDLRRVLASAYSRLGRTDEAREQYLMVARSPQARSDDWVKLGEIAYKANKNFDAMHASRKAIELDPLSPSGYLLAGMVWQKQDKLDEALQMFDRAAELSPDDAAPLILRGLSLQQAGRTAAAAESYRKALERSPEDNRARQLLETLSSAAP